VEKDYTKGEYGPDLVNDYVLDFVSRKQAGPFFVYYPMMLTHDPYQATPDSPDYDRALQGEAAKRDVKHFGEMVEYMDKLIGKVVARLEALGIRDNTLLVFVGDNGTGRGTPSKMGERTVIGGKGTTTAAGMHVPLIVSWPGRAAAGKVHHNLVDSTDFLPTVLEAAGAKLPAGIPFDGRSFLPQVRGEKGQPRDWIYSWYSPRQQANLSVREFAFTARYKLYRTGEFHDLASDLEEKSPLTVAALTGERAAAAKLLQGALDRYTHVRDPKLDQIGLAAIEGKKSDESAAGKKTKGARKK
jgi:arylsulfatase A